MFIIEYRKNSTMLYSKLKSKLFVWLHQGMVINEHQHVTKMALSVSVGSLWGDFTKIF